MKKRKYIWVTGIIILIICSILSCYYEEITYTLTVLHEGDGTTVPSGEIEVPYGEPEDITAIPDEYWEFETWEILSGTGCTIADTDKASTTVTLNTGNAIIRANFVDAQAPEGYSVSIDQPYINAGSTVLSFTYYGAEVGGTYHYSIDDDNGGTTPITGTGVLTTESAQVTGINVSTLDDGTLELLFYTTDCIGNEGDPIQDTVIKDTLPPEFADITHNGTDDYYMPGETISFTIDMGESGITVTADLSVLESTFGTTAEFTGTGGSTYTLTTPALTGSMAEGTDIAVTFTAADPAGNTATESGLSLILDKTPPSGSFSINNGNANTITGSVTLNMAVPDAAWMRFGNTPEQAGDAEWASYTESTSFTLTSGLGVNTVYGEFMDIAGNVYETSDDIQLIKKITASDGTSSDNFDNSVAVSADGSVVVVGAHNDSSGSVYVYNGTNWETETKITPDDSAPSDNFGYSVAVSSDGNIIVVGAYGNSTLSGSVYLYYGMNWATEIKITPDGSAEGDYFGYSVAISSDSSTIVAGAYRDGDNGSDSGSVYVYHGTNWNTETKITPSDGASGDYFGYSIAVSSDGGTIVAGAYEDDSKGSVYVFNGTNWSTETKITSSDNASFDYFGYSLAVSSDGSAIFVGAVGDDENGSGSGSVYVYNGINYTTETKIIASDGAAGDSFGYSISVSPDGNTIAVGACYDDDNGSLSGSVYIFNGANWSTEAKITPSDGAENDYFSQSVAVSSDSSTIIVGANGDDDNGSGSGSAYILVGTE